MANKAALVLLLVISLAGKTLHGVFVYEKNKDYTIQRIFIQPPLWHFLRRLPKSSGKRNVPVWRPSVCLSRHSRVFSNVNRARGATHTQRDSPEGSTHFHPSIASTDTHLYCNILIRVVSCAVIELATTELTPPPEATPPPGAVDDGDVRENDHKFGRGRHQYADTRGGRNNDDDEVRLNTSGRDCKHA